MNSHAHGAAVLLLYFWLTSALLRPWIPCWMSAAEGGGGAESSKGPAYYIHQEVLVNFRRVLKQRGCPIRATAKAAAPPLNKGKRRLDTHMMDTFVCYRVAIGPLVGHTPGHQLMT